MGYCYRGTGSQPVTLQSNFKMISNCSAVSSVYILEPGVLSVHWSVQYSVQDCAVLSAVLAVQWSGLSTVCSDVCSACQCSAQYSVLPKQGRTDKSGQATPSLCPPCLIAHCPSLIIPHYRFWQSIFIRVDITDLSQSKIDQATRCLCPPPCV